MFEPNLSIDVSLLGIILGLYATKNDKNLILVLLCILFAHILLTNDDDGEHGLAVREHDGSNVEGDNEEPSQVENVVDVADNSLGVGADRSTVDINTKTTSPPPLPENKSSDQVKTTVSYGVFDRQLSTPQTNFTSTVFPATSVEANGKLASARQSFFKSLVS